MESVKAALRAHLDITPPKVSNPIPWNESRPTYEDENDEVWHTVRGTNSVHGQSECSTMCCCTLHPQMYRQGQWAIADKFMATIKPKLSPSQLEDAKVEAEALRLRAKLQGKSPSGSKQASSPAKLYTPKRSGVRGSPSTDTNGVSPVRTITLSPMKPIVSPAVTALQTLDAQDHEDHDDDDSSLHSGPPEEFVDEEEEEVDLNAQLRKAKDGIDYPTSGNIGALAQLYTVDERKRTDIFRPRRSLVWTVLYIIFGVGLPGVIAAALLVQMVCSSNTC